MLIASKITAVSVANISLSKSRKSDYSSSCFAGKTTTNGNWDLVLQMPHFFSFKWRFHCRFNANIVVNSFNSVFYVPFLLTALSQKPYAKLWQRAIFSSGKNAYEWKRTRGNVKIYLRRVKESNLSDIDWHLEKVETST